MDGLDNTSIAAEAKSSVNFTNLEKNVIDFTLQCGQKFFVC